VDARGDRALARLGNLDAMEHRGLGGAWRPPPPPGLPGSKPGLQHPGAGVAGSLPPAPASAVVAVCSGKGGVGKSTVALNLAAALAADGLRVGLLDADVHAPDIPLMVGLARRVPATEWVLARRGGLARTRLEPVERYRVRLMSTGFLFGEDQPVAWTADLVQALLNQLIWSTVWGELDVLLIDLPPGTSDITQAIVRLLPAASAVLVVTPQDVAHLDTRRVLAMLAQAGVPVLGGVENMSWLLCPCCDTRIRVFPPVAAERAIWAGGLSLLASVPLEAAGHGDGTGDHRDAVVEPVVVTRPDGARARAFRAAAAAVCQALRAQAERRDATAEDAAEGDATA
jgi:ATP-binding protein involved in chromosome partitioning